MPSSSPSTSEHIAFVEMLIWIILPLLIAAASAQYIAVGEPNPSAPACPVDDVPPCPDDPPVPIPPPPPIQNAFEAVFRHMDQLIKTRQDSTAQLHQHNLQISSDLVRRIVITDNVESILTGGHQLIDQLWGVIISDAAAIVKEFINAFNAAVSYVKKNVRLAIDDPRAQAELLLVHPVTEQTQCIYVNIALKYRQFCVDAFTKYANTVRQLHSQALASACPKQLQQQFQAASVQMARLLDELLQRYWQEDHQIIDNYRNLIRRAAAVLRDLQIADVTLLLT